MTVMRLQEGCVKACLCTHMPVCICPFSSSLHLPNLWNLISNMIHRGTRLSKVLIPYNVMIKEVGKEGRFYWSLCWGEGGSVSWASIKYQVIYRGHHSWSTDLKKQKTKPHTQTQDPISPAAAFYNCLYSSRWTSFNSGAYTQWCINLPQ